MLFNRQKLLLGLVDVLGGEVSNTDFQKLLFLYCCTKEATPSYEFVPYKFGGFSFTSYADKRRLIEQDFLFDDEKSWKLLPAGKPEKLLSSAERQNLEHFCRQIQGLRGDALVAQTYRLFPYYATRSEIANRVLGNDAEALAKIAAARPKFRGAGLCTIGYEGATLESYLNRLLRAGVTLLCDVRRNPLSRKYGFSKGTLSKACQSIGINYVHLPQLGIASEERRELESQADYDKLFASYEQTCLPQETDAVAKIHEWIKGGERVSLTCFERLPHQCHRHCVAEAVASSAGGEMKILHL